MQLSLWFVVNAICSEGFSSSGSSCILHQFQSNTTKMPLQATDRDRHCDGLSVLVLQGFEYIQMHEGSHYHIV